MHTPELAVTPPGHLPGLISSVLLARCRRVVAAIGSSAWKPHAVGRDSRATLEMARAYLAMGNSVRAGQHLALALHLGHDPREVVPLMLQGRVQSSRLRGALNCIRAHLQSSARDYGLRLLAVGVHLALGETGQALGELQQLIQDHPRSAVPHYVLGVLTVEADSAAAQAHFRAFLELASVDPNRAEIRALEEHLGVHFEGSPPTRTRRARREDPHSPDSNRQPPE